MRDVSREPEANVFAKNVCKWKIRKTYMGNHTLSDTYEGIRVCSCMQSDGFSNCAGGVYS